MLELIGILALIPLVVILIITAFLAVILLVTIIGIYAKEIFKCIKNRKKGTYDERSNEI